MARRLARYAMVMLGAAVGVVACGDSLSEQAKVCIEGYGSDAMSAEDIQTLRSSGLPDCFTQRTARTQPAFDSQAERLAEEGAELPVTVGRDARNDLAIEVFYGCSDVCPDAGFVGIGYVDVAEADCCAAGGIPQYDAAWGGYQACVPPEVAESEDACG